MTETSMSGVNNDTLFSVGTIYGANNGWRLFLAVSAICVSFMAVMFNAVIILVILLTRSLRTPTNVFIISMAVSEVLIGLFHAPPVASTYLANGWPFSQGTCRASATLQVIGRTSGTLSLVSMCIDRCVAVSRPLAYSQIITFKFSATMVTCAWLLAVVMGLLPLGLWGSYRFSGTFSTCIMQRTPDHHQHLVKEFICTFAPSLVILTCLAIIIREVKSHHRVFALFPVPSAQMVTSDSVAIPGFLPGARSFNRNTMKALRPLFVMCFLYGLFVLPASCLYLTLQKRVTSLEFGFHPAICIVVWLSILSPILNPIIAIFFKRKFRARVKSMCRITAQVWAPKPTKEPFTISTGLQNILSEATWIGKLAKPSTCLQGSLRGQRSRLVTNY